MVALQAAVDGFARPAFPCALILGDVVILDLLHRLDLLASGRVPIVFIDTFHLFPETHQLLHKLEARAARPLHARPPRPAAARPRMPNMPCMAGTHAVFV